MCGGEAASRNGDKMVFKLIGEILTKHFITAYAQTLFGNASNKNARLRQAIN
jgi:hypothetical protein